MSFTNVAYSRPGYDPADDPSNRLPDPSNTSMVGTKRAVQALLAVLRSSAPGAWSDNRLEQSNHFTGPQFLAINTLMKQAAASELTVYHRDRKDPAQRKPAPMDDALVRLLESPNNLDDYGLYMRRLVQQIGLTGTALNWTVPNGFNKPKELYILPTALATPLPQYIGFPQGAYRVMPMYPYGPFGMVPNVPAAAGATIDARQIFRVQNPHPYLRYDGYSDLTAMRLQADTVENIDRARLSQQQKGTDPSLHLNFDSTQGWNPSQEDLERYRAQIEAVMAGPMNAGKILFTTNTDVNTLSTTPKDMAWQEGWEQLIGFVLSGYGVPKSVSGMSEDTSFAQLFAALKQFHWITLEPLLQMIALAFNKHLCPLFGPQYWLEIKPRRIDDPTIKQAKANGFVVAKACTKNEYRLMLDEEPTEEEWGEQIVGEPPPQQQAGAVGGQQSAVGSEQTADRRLLTAPGQRELHKNPVEEDRPENEQGEGALGPRKSLVGALASVNGHAKSLNGHTGNGKTPKAEPATETVHKYASTQFNLPDEIAERVRAFGRDLPKRHLAEDGLEDQPHITLKYGLHRADPSELHSIVKNVPPVKVRLGKLSVFPNAEHDVLKADVEGDGLHELNKIISESFPHTDKYDTYRPHITLAYLKPGLGRRYAGRDLGITEPITLGRIILSDTGGRKWVVPLARQEQSAGAVGGAEQKTLTDYEQKALPPNFTGIAPPDRLGRVYEWRAGKRLKRHKNTTAPGLLSEFPNSIWEPVEWAQAIQQLADEHPVGFGDRKVFIHHVYEAAKQRSPQLTMERFKDALADANRAGRVKLTRADLVEVMHPEDVRASTVSLLGRGSADPGYGPSANFMLVKERERQQIRGPEQSAAAGSSVQEKSLPPGFTGVAPPDAAATAPADDWFPTAGSDWHQGNDWTESKHPRDTDGLFIPVGALRAAARDPDKAAALRESLDEENRAKLDEYLGKGPEEIDKDAPEAEKQGVQRAEFGGPERSIENESYMDGKMPELDDLVKQGAKEGVTLPFGATSWDDLDDDAKSKTKDAWVEDNAENYYDSALTSWRDSLYDETVNEVKRDSDWNMEQFQSWAEDQGFTKESATTAMTWKNRSLDVAFDHLTKEDGEEFTEDEQEEAEKDWNTHLEEVGENEVKSRIEDALEDVPDSVREEADEAARQAFEDESDSEQFKAAKTHGYAEGDDVAVAEPDKWQPFSDGEDYKTTHAVALYVQAQRAEALFKERGLTADVDKVSNKVWSEWKRSSTSPLGLALQAAAAEELGGQLRLPSVPQKSVTFQNAQKDAVRMFGDKAPEILRAYARATWEASQYVLRKANLAEIVTWRGVMLPRETIKAAGGSSEEQEFGKYQQLPNLKLLKNGCASATSSMNVANDWSGVGTNPPDSQRVVLRIKAPRGAVLSLPCFGQNVYEEEEIVLAGTMWNAWDAWLDKAPDEFTPFKE